MTIIHNTKLINIDKTHYYKMIDFVVPNNNEEEFIAMAERLGYKELFFLYNLHEYITKQEKSEKNNNKVNKIKIHNGVLADKNTLYKIQNKLKDKEVFVAIKSSSNDKEAIEKSRIDMVFSFEENPRKDFIHHRASGLNHILCKMAKENNVAIGFSIKSLLDAGNKPELLGRIMQNMKLCRKFEVKTSIASFATNPFEMRGAHDLTSLFKILGTK